MTGLGTILNTACILLGGLAGLFIFRNISTKTQQNLKLAIALVSLAIGFMMMLAVDSDKENTQKRCVAIPPLS